VVVPCSEQAAVAGASKLLLGGDTQYGLASNVPALSFCLELGCTNGCAKIDYDCQVRCSSFL
jgi:hypothetical protein